MSIFSEEAITHDESKIISGFAKFFPVFFQTNKGILKTFVTLFLVTTKIKNNTARAYNIYNVLLLPPFNSTILFSQYDA